MHSRTRESSRRPIVILAATAAGVATIGLAACSSEPVEVGADLPSRLLPGDAVPLGFTVIPTQVGDMIAANRSTLDQAATVGFAPVECKPTADADFNPKLTEENTVLLVAQSDTGTFSELVSTVRRNVDADRRDTSGVCRVVTATPSTGSLAGVPIVTTTTELPAVRSEHAVQSYLVRTDTVKTPVGGSPRSRSAFLANVLVKRPSGDVVTVQVGLSGHEVTAPQSAPPLSEAEFAELVDRAVERAAAL